MRYRRDHWKDVDLNRLRFDYPVDITRLSEELIHETGAESEDGIVWLDGHYIDQKEIPYEAVDFDSAEPNDLLDGLMAKAKHYLVFAKNCRWNGSSGYKFARTIKEAVDREYETTQRVVNISPRGKSVLVMESSHDVPTGATTVIIGLTEREYERLKDASFEVVQGFAESHASRLC